MNLPRMKIVKKVHIILPDKEPPFRDRMRGTEMGALMRMEGARSLLTEAGTEIEYRAKKAKLWWRYRGLVNQLEKLISEIENTCEAEQLETLAVRLTKITANVGVDKAGEVNGAHWFMVDDINEVCHAVLEDTCTLCQKKGAEAKKCPLQRALKSMTTLQDKREIDGCIFKPYSDAAYYGLLDEEEKEDTAI